MPKSSASDLSMKERRSLLFGFMKFFTEEPEQPEQPELATDNQPGLVTEPNAGISAAGTMIVDPANRVLFVKRSAVGDHPGTWCFPGGALENGETSAECARRETQEEVGYEAAEDSLIPFDTLHFGDVGYTTHLHRAERPFEPSLNAEHTDATWVPWGNWPAPLHPGVENFLDYLKSRVDAHEARLAAGYGATDAAPLGKNPDYHPGVEIISDFKKNSFPLREALIGCYGYDEGLATHNSILELIGDEVRVN